MAKFSGFNGEYSGLSNSDVKERQTKYGKNILIPEKRQGFVGKFLNIFKEPMFLLLFGTALIYFILGDAGEGIIMLIFVCFMAFINFFQEWKTDKTLEALKDLSSPHINVIRNDRIETVDSRELTAGDLMILKEGEKIPADGIIVEMSDFAVDESTLTGESEIVWKDKSQKDDENSHWRRDYCYAGTMVTQGTAIVEITAIGQNTEYGKIGTDIATIPDRPTPLEKQTGKLVKASALFGLVLCVMVFMVTYEHSKDLVDSILSGITLAMAMIPEEFPVILTVFLAMGAWRLAKKNSIIRRIPAVETLGSVSVLCVDKTGTLTQNKMTLRDMYCGEQNNKELLYWSALACEIEPYDPMEKAILKAAEDEGYTKDTIFKYPLEFEYPFYSEIKMMGHVWNIDGQLNLAAKGSPESIIPLCDLNDEQMEKMQNQQREMASNGLRVIAVAKTVINGDIPQELSDNHMQLIGLLGLADPPREGVKEAVAKCHRAGMRVVMITGDNGTTAQAIGRELGISDMYNVITGEQLDQMSDDELREKVKNTNIFARVIPRHKMRIVSALQSNGEVVAMTGDGVNDAPALKESDIGIAMGKRGTEVAKEAADMVLLDDNFTTIVETVADGRRIYDNIKKAIGYVIVIHLPIALMALLAPILHLPLVLMPIHVVLLELIIDPTCSIIFERLPAEKDLMGRNPRSPKEHLVTKGLLIKSVLQGLAIFAAVFGSYIFMMNKGWTVESARTFSLVVLVLANLLLVYVNESNIDYSILNIFSFRDKQVQFVNLLIILMTATIVYLPGANKLAKTTPLEFGQVLAALGIAVISTFWWDIVKIFKRRNILSE